jgi:Bacterial PH domain
MPSAWATHFDIIEDASNCPVFKPTVVPAVAAQGRRRESARSTIMIYRSKVDSMAPTVLITLTACFIIMGLIILIGTGSAMGWVILILCPPILPLIVMLVTWPMTYDTGATRSDGEPILLVRGGRLLRYEIPIAGIKEVRPTNSVASSMSWSYDRIEILSRSLKVGYAGSLMISPKDRDAFLDDLGHRTGLMRVGDRLTPRQDAHAAP